MLEDIARLGRETAIYGISTVLGRALNFLLLPVYTHLLTPSEYGIVATGFSYIAFFNVLFQYGMDQSYLRFTAPEEGGPTTARFTTAFVSVAAVSAVLSAALWIFAGPLAPAAGIPAWAIRLSAVILATDAVQAIPLAELRRAHHAWHYVTARTLNIVANVALNLILVWRWKMGPGGVYWASLLASAVGLVVLLPVLFRWLRPAFEVPAWREMVRFALPYVPAGLASMAVQVIDRPILAWFTNDATVGIYQANYRLGIVMMMAVNMFDAAWRPFFLERGERPGVKELFGRILTYWVLGGAFLFLALSLFMPELVRIPVMGRPIIDARYWEGLPIVPVVLFAYLLNGIYLNFMPQVMLTKRSERVAYATAVGAIVNVGTIFAFIPRWGMMGAAWATLLAYAAMAVTLYALGRPLMQIPYEWRRLGKVGAALAAILGALWWTEPMLGAGSRWLGARAVGLASFPVLLWAFGFFRPEELRAVSSRLRLG